MQNKIIVYINAETEKVILQRIAELADLMPDGLITLTEEDRKGIAIQ
jgi:hypothetical protein